MADAGKRFPSQKPSTVAANTRGRVGWLQTMSGTHISSEPTPFLGCIIITALDWNNQTHHEPNKNPFMQKLAWFWFLKLSQTVLVQHRFSAFWLRSKCSICSYQLNIWYGGHVPPSILNWFLQGDEVQELAPASSRVGLALQYRQDRPTSPLNTRRSSPCIMFANGRHCLSTKNNTFLHKALTLDSIHSTTFSVLICQIFSGIYSALAIPPICQEEQQPLLSTVKTIFLKLKRTSSSRDLLLSPNSLWQIYLFLHCLPFLFSILAEYQQF